MTAGKQQIRTVGAVLFEEFELLDVFGPLEMFGVYPETFKLITVAERAGRIISGQGPKAIADYGFDDSPHIDILLVPGGRGTRREVSNERLLNWLKRIAGDAEFITSVCTGAALLAAAGALEGKRATSNKKAFPWVVTQGQTVRWVAEARWIEDGNTVTAAGISAGMDMALRLVERILGTAQAEQAARWAEYEWHSDASWDPFAKQAGLV